MRAQSSAFADGIDLGALGGALRRTLAALLAAALAAGLASCLLLSLITPRYAVQAQIEIVTKGHSLLEPSREPAAAEVGARHLHREAIGSHVRALMSTDLAVRVAADLGLAAKPEFNSALAKGGAVGQLLRWTGLAGLRTRGSEQDRVFDAYYRALRVSQLGETPRINIEFRSADSQLAADAANKLVELYRDDLVLRAVLETLDGRARLATAVEVETVLLAQPPTEKAWPKVGMITLLAMAATLLLGLAFVVARELVAMRREPAHDAHAAPASQPAVRLPAPTTVRTMPAVAHRLVAKAGGRAGFRTLVAGETAGTNAGVVAIDLARLLARQQRQVVLLDWSLDGVGLAQELAVSPTLGITDVLSGHATFEDVIERLGGSEAHVIAAGSSAAGAAAARDKDHVSMLLDALDDAYEHVVITGAHEAVRDLFTTIEARIDAGVVIAGAGGRAAPGNFLGFNVADLDVIRYEPVARHQSGASLLTLRAALI